MFADNVKDADEKHGVPPGYTFMGFGYPDLASRCKELCKEQDLDIRIVSVSHQQIKQGPDESISRVVRVRAFELT